MEKHNQTSNWLIKILGSATLAGVIAILAFAWNIGESRSAQQAQDRQLANQATQIALQGIQIDLMDKQNQLVSERATSDAQKAIVENQLLTPVPANNPEVALTATALALQAIQISATSQAIVEKQQQIEATQTAILISMSDFECSENDYVPNLGAIKPPTDTEICIPDGTVGWISSDPARFTIPGVYNEPPTTGFTFALFGPAKFTISGIQNNNNVRLDLRADSSLVGNYDGKLLNLIYKDGQVCEHEAFTGSRCP